MILNKNNQFITLLIFALIAALFLFKLDRHYYFTDEILYVQRGLEHFQGIYNDTLQVPPLPKYFAALSYSLANGNLLFARLPYAIIGVISSYIIYLIVKREYGTYLGYAGALLFTTSRIIFDASRMIMLEPLMHLFWLLFLYFYYVTFSKSSTKTYLISGLFLGLSLSTKLTSIVLLPFVAVGFVYKFVTEKELRIDSMKNYAYMFAASVFTGLLGYVHFFYKSGILTALFDTAKNIKEVYLTKSEVGKEHAIGDTVYVKSPWWTYLYYFVVNNGILRFIFYIITLPLALAQRNFFTYYWFVFFILIAAFNQISGVKNIRYISSIEIPLVILSIAGLNFCAIYFKKFNKSSFLRVGIFLLLSFFLAKHISYLNNLTYTEYAGLYRYFKQETDEFKQYKRMFVFGSVRSLKYYRDLLPDINMLLWRRDYNVMCPEFQSFDYFAFDKDELLKNPDNFLYQYVLANIANFEEVPQISDMYVYKKLNEFDSVIACPKIEQ